jgi:hypothetical protein
VSGFGPALSRSLTGLISLFVQNPALTAASPASEISPTSPVEATRFQSLSWFDGGLRGKLLCGPVPCQWLSLTRNSWPEPEYLRFLRFQSLFLDSVSTVQTHLQQTPLATISLGTRVLHLLLFRQQISVSSFPDRLAKPEDTIGCRGFKAWRLAQLRQPGLFQNQKRMRWQWCGGRGAR